MFIIFFTRGRRRVDGTYFEIHLTLQSLTAAERRRSAAETHATFFPSAPHDPTVVLVE
jgi:hypothetical protein